jgi:Protein of unknown function (DUF3304)
MPERHLLRLVWRLTVAAVTCVALLSACSRSDEADRAAPILKPLSLPATPAASTPQSSQLRYSLGIVGYNYTEVGIDDFKVNGTGAFNLGVSTETSGGGSTICCAGWAPGTKLPRPVVVEWQRHDNDGKPHWCRATAVLNGPVPLEPTTLEVHIYPDRHIEAAITDDYSPPRLKMPRAGAAYRVGKDLHAENTEAIKKDALTAECQDSEFPLANDYYFQQLKKFELLQKRGNKP